MIYATCNPVGMRTAAPEASLRIGTSPGRRAGDGLPFRQWPAGRQKTQLKQFFLQLPKPGKAVGINPDGHGSVVGFVAGENRSEFRVRLQGTLQWFPQIFRDRDENKMIQLDALLYGSAQLGFARSTRHVSTCT